MKKICSLADFSLSQNNGMEIGQEGKTDEGIEDGVADGLDRFVETDESQSAPNNQNGNEPT